MSMLVLMKQDVTPADIIQIGARNMNNFGLLEAVGEMRKPVLLKRGNSSTIEELLMAAGADGVMIEVHPESASALSDGPQSLKPYRFTELMHTLWRLAPVLDRTIAVEEAA
jgi:3-deoxy-D-arabino-heptulosonate 7-phosphate (DAHP) synthase